MYSRVVRFALFVLFLAIAVPMVGNAGGPPCPPWFAKVPDICAFNDFYAPDGVWTKRGRNGPERWAIKLTVKTLGKKIGKGKRTIAGKRCLRPRPVRWCR